MKIRFYLALVLIQFFCISTFSCSYPISVKEYEKQLKNNVFKATIYRDIMGVPHIFGKTDADAVFGLAYAHSEDDFKTIQDLLLGARAKLGSVYGIKYVPVDYYVGLIGVWDQVNNRYEKEIPKEIKIICEAYASGINQYAIDNPNEAREELFPLNGKDIIAGWMYQIPYLYGIEKTLAKLFEKEKPDFALGFQFDQNTDLDPLNIDLIGSNVIGVSPDKSEDGHTRLLINCLLYTSDAADE